MGHVIKDLMGDFYYPLYLTDERYRDTFQVKADSIFTVETMLRYCDAIYCEVEDMVTL